MIFQFQDGSKMLYQSTTETILEFVKMSTDDYGSYVCRVHNKMGTDQQEIIVSGMSNIQIYKVIQITFFENS